jgi:hypothetical protein
VRFPRSRPQNPGEIADVARQSDLTAIRSELKGEMAEMRGEIARLSARMDGLLPKFLWANVPVMFGVAGLVLAAAKVA